MADAASSSIGVAAGLVVVVAGWFVVNRQTNDRESRKELRVRIDAAKKTVDTVLTAAREYFGAREYFPEKHASVISHLSILSAEIEAVRQWVGRSVRLPLRQSLTWALVEFRQALTSRAQSAADFDDNSRQQDMFHSALAAGNLVAILESFFNRYVGRPKVLVRFAGMMVGIDDWYQYYRSKGYRCNKSLYCVLWRCCRRCRARIRLLIQDVRK